MFAAPHGVLGFWGFGVLGRGDGVGILWVDFAGILDTDL